MAILAGVGVGQPNRSADVLIVQEHLKRASRYLRDGGVHPGPIDGKAGPGVVGAIMDYQGRFMRRPDGIISPGGLTIRRMGALERMAKTVMSFPLVSPPSRQWNAGMRAFGVRRSGGRRAHAGCDLYASAGTDVVAMASGVVLKAYPFYASTWAIEVDHGAFVVRYGEVAPGIRVRKGDRVQAGTMLGEVGRLKGIRVPSNMLHLEMFDKTARGNLTQKRNTARHVNGKPFLRRRDLIDPTVFLMDAHQNSFGRPGI